MKIEIGKIYLFSANNNSLFNWCGTRKILVIVVDLISAGPSCPGVITEDKEILEYKRNNGITNRCWYVKDECLSIPIITDVSQMDIEA